MTTIELGPISNLGPFSFRWPDGIEEFESGWRFTARVDGVSHDVKHGIGRREVYGRIRVHTVTWLDGQVQVEGVEADDYPTSQTLISRLRRPGRATVRAWAEVPAGYDDFTIVEHRREIDARYSPECLAVKVREDDLASWALHAWLRSRLPRNSTSAAGPRTPAPPPVILPPAPTPDAQAVGRALLAHADALAEL